LYALSQAIGKDDHDFSFKGQKAVFNKQIRTTTGLFTSEQYVKNRASSPLSQWKQDYMDAGNTTRFPKDHKRLHLPACLPARLPACPPACLPACLPTSLPATVASGSPVPAGDLHFTGGSLVHTLLPGVAVSLWRHYAERALARAGGGDGSGSGSGSEGNHGAAAAAAAATATAAAAAAAVAAAAAEADEERAEGAFELALALDPDRRDAAWGQAGGDTDD
jgi:hypothetical protein